jgi:hypothetical protein
LTLSCENEKKQKKLSKSDLKWIEFVTALENDDYDYLINNSLDTIQCTECEFIENNESDLYSSKFLFSNPKYVKKLKHIDSLLHEEFTTYEVPGMIKVNYKIKSRYAPEGGYNLIFTFVLMDDKYLFTGMLVT